MKGNSRKLFKQIVALFLAIVILGGIPVTVSAEQNFPNAKVGTIDTLNELDNVIQSGDENYSYVPPDEGKFLIENVTGTISITNGIAILRFANNVVTMPAFDFYKIVDQDGNVRFYQADVTKDPAQAGNFIYIAIYTEEASAYTIHIHYADLTENKLYNMVIPLTEEQFLQFDQLSTNLCLGSDEVSQRLKASARVYMQGTYENSENNANDVSINAIVPVDPGDGGGGGSGSAANTYDEYTDSDGIIRSYADDYFGEYYLEDGWTITDDPIVSIIPKELFFSPGTHIYVGKEYGFFMRVTDDSYNPTEHAIDVMVFDITHTAPSFLPNTHGRTKVEPIFQFRYRSTYERLIDMDPSLSGIVLPHVQYDYAEYYIKDVGMRFTLDNPTALNPGDNGYDPYEDDGAFIIQTRANIGGVGLKCKNKLFILDAALFGFGFIKKYGPIATTCQFAYDTITGFADGGDYLFSREELEANHEAFIDTGETNNTDQIREYGNLVKSETIRFRSKAESPCLLQVGGGYAEGVYVVARKSNSSNDRIRVITSVSVEIVEDNTYVLLGNPRGEIVSHGRGTGTHETGGYKRLDDITLNYISSVTIPANAQKNVIKITPATSGSYRIYTSSNNGDPNFRITNATKGTSAVSATDDIDGANNRNATLTINLIGGDIYYLEAFSYNPSYGYTLNIERNS